VAICSAGRISVIGKRIKGIRDVTASGIASVIQRIAINNAMAAIVFSFGLAGSKLSTKSRAQNATTPRINPNFLLICINSKINSVQIKKIILKDLSILNLLGVIN